MTSFLSKAANMVVFSSTMVLATSFLTGCINNSSTSDNLVSTANTTKVERQLSESLHADYAKMRANQIRDVNYQLTVNIDNKRDHFTGVSVLNFTLVKGNSNDLTIDFDEGTVTLLSINGKVTKINYDKWFITIPAKELSAGKNTITVAYQRPYSTDGSGFHRFVDPKNGEVYLYP